MAGTTDWHDWHAPYADGGSALSQRLRLVQRHIDEWLDERPEPALRVVSVCAGQGNDLLGVLERRADAGRVRAELIEKDRATRPSPATVPSQPGSTGSRSPVPMRATSRRTGRRCRPI
ncbi:hypothetical protein [Mangrovihabitans endophyticus]|uniref:hypothetical protein n=1 Tax=Mangrovihabitans endophyticus TaxID=1751298 RepID=UPI00166EDD88|nr:hypothetical protein [Mangrovihabitans endophyticus]